MGPALTPRPTEPGRLTAMECYFSTGAFPCRRMGEIVAACRDNGIGRLELSSAVAFEADMLAPVREALGEIRFLVHNYFPPPEEPFVLNLASTDSEIHRRSVALCERAVSLCAELGAPFYSVHSGFSFDLTPEMLGDPEAQAQLSQGIPVETAYKTFADTIRSLSAYGRDRGVGVLVENNVAPREVTERHGRDALLLSDVAGIQRFLDEIDDPSVGLLLDTGHAKVSARAAGTPPEEFFEALTPRIQALHLSDNDGERDTNQPFDRSAWFAPYLSELADVPMVVEVNGLETEELLGLQKELAAMVASPRTAPGSLKTCPKR